MVVLVARHVRFAELLREAPVMKGADERQTWRFLQRSEAITGRGARIRGVCGREKAVRTRGRRTALAKPWANGMSTSRGPVRPRRKGSGECKGRFRVSCR